jgi:hypothetical protein
MSDTEFKDMVFDIDEALATIAMKYEMHPLTMSAYVLARLVVANEFVGSQKEFSLVLDKAKDTIQKNAQPLH